MVSVPNDFVMSVFQRELASPYGDSASNDRDVPRERLEGTVVVVGGNSSVAPRRVARVQKSENDSFLNDDSFPSHEFYISGECSPVLLGRS